MQNVDLRNQVLAVCKQLIPLGLVTGTAGNVSARDPETGFVALKASGVSYSEMTVEDIVILDIDGNIIEQKEGRKSTFETPTHLEIYRKFPNVNGVIHTHSKYVNTLACVLDHIPCGTTPTAVRLLKKDIKVIDFIDNGTQEMADVVVAALEGSASIAIRNHGPFLVGETVELALERAVALEDTSQIYYQASLLGTPSLIVVGEK